MKVQKVYRASEYQQKNPHKKKKMQTFRSHETVHTLNKSSKAEFKNDLHECGTYMTMLHDLALGTTELTRIYK